VISYLFDETCLSFPRQARQILRLLLDSGIDPLERFGGNTIIMGMLSITGAWGNHLDDCVSAEFLKVILSSILKKTPTQ
jgi:hypothetical protein